MPEIKSITCEELKKHNKREDCWILLNGNVLDMTEFLMKHPGGESILLHYAGSDATKAFDKKQHSDDAKLQSEKFIIGKMVDEPYQQDLTKKTQTILKTHFTQEEVAEHNKKNDSWIIIEGKVYDITGFRNIHPGGPEILDQSVGQDATKMFLQVNHSNEAQEQMKDYYIGTTDSFIQGEKHNFWFSNLIGVIIISLVVYYVYNQFIQI